MSKVISDLDLLLVTLDTKASVLLYQYVCFILRYSFNFGLNRVSVSNCLSCALRNSSFASEVTRFFIQVNI